MAQQTIGVGTVANDNTGDPIRDAFVKVNANFDELFTLTGDDSNLRVSDDATDITLTSAIVNGGLILTPNGSGKVSLNSAVTRVVNGYSAPGTNVGVAGDQVGDIAIDATYLYLCVRNYDGGADAWLRSAIFTTF
jgi:hypothetical protein